MPTEYALKKAEEVLNAATAEGGDNTASAVAFEILRRHIAEAIDQTASAPPSDQATQQLQPQK